MPGIDWRAAGAILALLVGCDPAASQALPSAAAAQNESAAQRPLSSGVQGTRPSAPQAPVDLNQATRAEIESIRGIGVDLAERILQARAERPFRDIDDLRRRVKGFSRRAQQGLSEAGMPVGGQAVTPPP